MMRGTGDTIVTVILDRPKSRTVLGVAIT